MKKLVCMLGFAVLAASTSVEAGTLAKEYLDSIHGVAVHISVGGLLHAPLPGLERESFKSSATDWVAQELKQCGIDIVEDGNVTLLIDISKSSTALSTGLVALHVGAELREPAHLVRPWGNVTETQPPIVVTTWRSWSSAVGQESQALGLIREMISDLSDELAGAVRQAQVDPKIDIDDLDPISEACFDGTD